jgi:hypothetical protein
MSKNLLAGLGLLACLAFVPGVAQATPIGFQSDNANTQGDGTGFYAGTIDYQYTSGTTASFVVTLTNNTATGGHDLTGFAFNNPTGSGISSVSLTTVTGFANASNFANLATAPGKTVDVQPFGMADFGAATGGSWLGGGAPNGLNPGQTGTFTFTLTGTASGLASLTTQSFVDALTTGGGAPANFFVVRFRGGTNSDKEGSIMSPAPEPTSLVLMALTSAGLLGGAVFRRRSRPSA